ESPVGLPRRERSRARGCASRCGSEAPDRFGRGRSRPRGRRAGQRAFGWRAATGRDRARAPSRSELSRPRRADERARLRERTRGGAHDRGAAWKSHHRHRRSSTGNRVRGRAHRRARGRTRRPGRGARGPGRESRNVSGIIWLGSYPRSGNTWFRILLEHLLADASAPFDPRRPRVRNAAARELIDSALGIETSDLTHDEVDRLRPLAYERIARESRDEPLFLKTHDAWVEGADGRITLSRSATRG